MSINTQQREIINSIINNSDTNYEACGLTYLKGASAATAQAVEQEGLEKIGDRERAGNDDEIIEAIARWDLQNIDPSSLNQKINLYTLSHSSGYAIATDGVGSDAISSTSNSQYLTIVRNSLSEITNPDTTFSLLEQHNGYFPISSGIQYVGEKNILFGKNVPFGFSYSTSTAACVFGSQIPNPIVYQGYCFENQRGRTNYATGGSLRKRQYFFLTPGGGPLTQNNWMIKFNEYGIRYVNEEKDIYTNANSSWVCLDGDNNKYVILKIWIHVFLPDGSYVRTIIDRSDSADFSGVTSSMNSAWIYKDYANYQAQQNNLTFANIWNNRIYNKAYRPVGGIKPDVIDISFNWNGKLSLTQQKNQQAFLATNKSVKWTGGGLR